jgi:hypothetical protein
MSSPKFPLGQVVITRAAQATLSDADVRGALARHHAGDWGELDAHDLAENELSLEQGFRLLSAFTSSSGTKFWIITEADRSATTVLLPSDY